MTKNTTQREVWLENIRNHQIGGETDGVSPEVMEDLGFKPPKTQLDIGSSAIAETQTPIARGKNGRKLSMTPDAIRAREQRAAKKAQTQANIRENSDPWGADLGGI